jgi:chromosomal replication initiation ATPase DnaA
MIIPNTHSAAYAIPGMRRVPSENNNTNTVKDISFISPDKILGCVLQYYQISSEKLFKTSRIRPLAKARQICSYLLYNLAGMKLIQIAKFLKKDHSTIIHSNRVVKGQILCKVDNEYKREVEDILSLIYARASTPLIFKS